MSHGDRKKKTGLCPLCGSPGVEEILDFGAHPVANNFPFSSGEPEKRFRKRLGGCTACGFGHLTDPVPPSELEPRFDWIGGREPEGHLDELAVYLSSLEGISAGSKILGLSYKDASLMERMAAGGRCRRGYLFSGKNLSRIGAGIRGAGADLIVARHSLEHVSGPGELLLELREGLSPGGYLVVEVPSCDHHLERFDYSMLWEEHSAYFTPETLRRGLHAAGFELVDFRRAAYALEDSLVLVGRKGASAPLSGPSGGREVEVEMERLRLYGRKFPAQRRAVRSFFENYAENTGKIAFLGAGHLGCTFVNLFDLGGRIDCFVDDHPGKAGLFTPGARLPILPGSALMERGISLCMLGVNPDIEEKVIGRNRAFVERGGRFLSIFPGSEHALKVKGGRFWRRA